MTAGSLDITIEQGSDYFNELVWKDSNENIVTLTGYSAKMEIRSKYGSIDVLLELSTVNGRITISELDGQIILQIPSAVTELITWTTGVYDLELTGPTGIVTRLLQGKVTVIKEVTK